jgi:hypothetical protein
MADQNHDSAAYYGIRVYFIARFLARSALIGARRCSSAKRRAAFTSLTDSDPGHREARARAGRVRQHDKAVTSSWHPTQIMSDYCAFLPNRLARFRCG